MCGRHRLVFVCVRKADNSRARSRSHINLRTPRLAYMHTQSLHAHGMKLSAHILSLSPALDDNALLPCHRACMLPFHHLTSFTHALRILSIVSHRCDPDANDLLYAPTSCSIVLPPKAQRWHDRSFKFKVDFAHA